MSKILRLYRTNIFLLLILSAFTTVNLYSQDSVSSNTFKYDNLNKEELYKGFNPHNIGIKLGYLSFTSEEISEYFDSTVCGSLFYNFAPGLLFNLSFQAELGFFTLDLKSNNKSKLFVSTAFINTKLYYPISKRVNAFINIGGGGYLGYFNAELASRQYTSTNLAYKFSSGLDINLDYNHKLSLSATYQYLYDKEMPLKGFIYSIGYSYRFGEDPSLRSDDVISIKKISIQNVFSSIYKSYSMNPIGIIRLQNISDDTIKSIKVQVLVNEYMDFPTDSKIYPELKKNEAVVIPLYAVFNNKVLEITEDTPQAMKLKIIYQYENKTKVKIQYEQFRLFNRNAMTWDNTKKLASFITVKDPTIKIFTSTLKQKLGKGFTDKYSLNVQTAISFFNLLSEMKIVYSVDPSTPFVQYSQNSSMVDYIQYPRDTLKYKTGDCDDLTTLFCTLLESVGIETALVTVPEHIFMMFNTGLTKTDYDLIHPNPEHTYIIDGFVWLPVEVTKIGSSFVDSWNNAAKQVNKFKNSPADFKIIKIREAWESYDPVTLKTRDWDINIPEIAKVIDNSKEEYDFIKNKVFVIEQNKLEKKIIESPEDIESLMNLAILYAKKGEFNNAKDKFQMILEIDERNFYALYNLGNIFAKEKDYENALLYYEKALSVNPDDYYTKKIVEITKKKLNNN